MYPILISLFLIFLKSKPRKLGVLCDVSQPKHKKPFRRKAKGILANSQLNRMIIWVQATRKISCGTNPAIFRSNTAFFDILRIQAPRDWQVLSVFVFDTVFSPSTKEKNIYYWTNCLNVVNFSILWQILVYSCILD